MCNQFKQLQSQLAVVFVWNLQVVFTENNNATE